MILTIDTVPVPIPEPLQTISCILCDSIISFANKDPSRLFKHLQDHHQVHLNHNLLLSINLIDNDLIGKVILAGCQSLNMVSNESLKVIVDEEINIKSKPASINGTVRQLSPADNTKDGSTIKTVLKNDIEQLAFDEDKILSKYFSVLDSPKFFLKEEKSEDYSKSETIIVDDVEQPTNNGDNILPKNETITNQKTPKHVSKMKISDDNGIFLRNDIKQLPIDENKILPKYENSTTHKILDDATKTETNEECSFDKSKILINGKPNINLTTEYSNPKSRLYALRRKKKCPYCKQVLSTLQSLSTHVRTHHGLKNVLPTEQFCHECNDIIEIVDNETLIKHYHFVHVQEHKCQFCKKVFLSETTLNAHIQRHHGTEQSDKILICVKCNFSTYIFGEYGKHKKECDLVCGVCEKEFPKKFFLKRHMDHIHLNMVNTDTTLCPQCGKSCRTVSIRDHMNRFHSDKCFQCPDCDYTHPINAYVTRHHKRRHGYVITPCDDCGKEVKHIDKHKAESCSARKITNKTRIQCDQCDKTFGYQVGLKRHIKNIHMDMKDNFCKLCDYKTYSSGNLRSHISRVHDGNSVKTACKYCDKSVSTAGMDWHIHIYHSHLQKKELKTK